MNRSTFSSHGSQTSRRTLFFAPLLAVLFLSASVAVAQERPARPPVPIVPVPKPQAAHGVTGAEPTKLAYLVGVSKYEKAGLRDLAYAEDDMTVLAEALKGAGFKVEVQLGSDTGDKRATRENLKKHLEMQFAESIKRLKKDDLVLIALSGHGQQLSVEKGGRLVEDAYYCPVDALKTDPATLLSVSDLMELVGRNSGAENNLFVIDACRDNPAKGGKGIDGSRISLPGNMAALFGASSGTQSFESDQLKHGLLTYYLLEGLTKAKDDDNEVNWDALVGYTKKQVSKNAPLLVNSKQIPSSVSNIKGAPPILAKVGAKVAPNDVVDSPKTGDARKNEEKVTSPKAPDFDLKISGSTKRTISKEDSHGKEVWRSTLGAAFLNKVVDPDGSRCFVLCDDGSVSAMDMSTGREIWKQKSDPKFNASNVKAMTFVGVGVGPVSADLDHFGVVIDYKDGHYDSYDPFTGKKLH